jgi:hypothetical protein
MLLQRRIIMDTFYIHWRGALLWSQTPEFAPIDSRFSSQALVDISHRIDSLSNLMYQPRQQKGLNSYLGECQDDKNTCRGRHSDPRFKRWARELNEANE